MIVEPLDRVAGERCERQHRTLLPLKAMARQQQLLMAAAVVVLLISGATAEPLSGAQLRPRSMRKLALVSVDRSATQTVPGSTTEPSGGEESSEATATPAPVPEEGPMPEPSSGEESSETMAIPAPVPEEGPLPEPSEDGEIVSSPAPMPESEGLTPDQVLDVIGGLGGGNTAPESEAVAPMEDVPAPAPEMEMDEDMLDLDDLVASGPAGEGPAPEMEMDKDGLDFDEFGTSGPASDGGDIETVESTLLSGPGIERSDLAVPVRPGQTAEDVRSKIQAVLAPEIAAKDSSG